MHHLCSCKVCTCWTCTAATRVEDRNRDAHEQGDCFQWSEKAYASLMVDAEWIHQTVLPFDKMLDFNSSWCQKQILLWLFSIWHVLNSFQHRQQEFSSVRHFYRHLDHNMQQLTRQNSCVHNQICWATLPKRDTQVIALMMGRGSLADPRVRSSFTKFLTVLSLPIIPISEGEHEWIIYVLLQVWVLLCYVIALLNAVDKYFWSHICQHNLNSSSLRTWMKTAGELLSWAACYVFSFVSSSVQQHVCLCCAFVHGMELMVWDGISEQWLKDWHMRLVTPARVPSNEAYMERDFVPKQWLPSCTGGQHYWTASKTYSPHHKRP